MSDAQSTPSSSPIWGMIDSVAITVNGCGKSFTLSVEPELLAKNLYLLPPFMQSAIVNYLKELLKS
jgi:hypothetical protein